MLVKALFNSILFLFLVFFVSLFNVKYVSGTSVCPRFAPGTAFVDSPSISSIDGLLSLTMNYESRYDATLTPLVAYGSPLSANIFCYETYPTGSTTIAPLASPILRVNPNDEIRLLVNNNLPSEYAVNLPTAPGFSFGHICGSNFITNATINLHFHGMSIPPQCEKDNVVLTLINPGIPFTYNFFIPNDAPPGLYGYHNHVHGTADGSIIGGSGGAIIVNGIENVYPGVAGLPERVIIFRDKPVSLNTFLNICNSMIFACTYDISVNQIGVEYPANVPVPYQIRPSNDTYTYREFWRVINAGSDNGLNISLIYDGVYQDLEVVSLDNIVVNSDFDQQQGTSSMVKYIFLGPFNRAEFIITSPQVSVGSAILNNNLVYGGPTSLPIISRPLIQLIPNESAVLPTEIIPNPTKPLNVKSNLPDINNYQVNISRTIIFSEYFPKDPNQAPVFYITVAGETPTGFMFGQAPSINTTVGSVERWTVINNSTENHVFHIHQMKFLLESVNGILIPVEERIFYDTFIVGYSNAVASNPSQVNATIEPSSITVLIHFTNETVGTFVYHCHIVAHEDLGMMASIYVAPQLEPIINSSLIQCSISFAAILFSFFMFFTSEYSL